MKHLCNPINSGRPPKTKHKTPTATSAPDCDTPSPSLETPIDEKSLKGFLLGKGRTYPRLHKVIELAKLCVELAADLEPLRNNLKLIDEFYIPTRYPDAIPGGLAEGLPGPEEAKLALDTATAILELVRGRV